MIGLYLQRVVLISAAAAACFGLAGRFGPATGAVIWAGVAALACGTGMALLRTSAVGRVTWRNRAAGYLIPWGWRLNRGRLWPVPVISWLVWMAVGTAVILLRPGQAEETPAIGIRAGLSAAWVVDAAALMFVAGSIGQATPGSRVGSLWKLAGAVSVMIAASVGLYLADRPEAALLVGGGPPAVIGASTGLVVLVLMTVGRNTRWN